MPSRPRDATETVQSAGDAPSTPLGLYLLVVGDGRLLTVPLPRRGELVLGREEDCDVALPHAKISRRHARVAVDDGVRIEDLGSTNGIRVGGERLERGCPVPLPVGESVKLGPFTAILLAGTSGAALTEDGLPRAALTVRDPTIEAAGELLERVARHPVSLLIQGETGTGKEVLARTLHQLSGRPGELVAINCAALTGELLESELFGHERGAFTGATRTKPGLLEVAGAGTVLLDEIGDLALDLQGKLLRALESRKVYRVGGVQPIDLQARVIAATHRRLPDEVARGAFRQDLYFRLNGLTLELPPLRERRGAIPTLAARFLDDAGRASGASAPSLSPAALATLAAHAWPGNVRELRQVIERAVLMSGGAPIEPRHLLLAPPGGTAAAAPTSSTAVIDERARFLELARRTEGNATAIARELGTSRSQVRRLAARFEVDLDALRRKP